MRVLVPDLLVTETAWERTKGLLGRAGLEPREALLIDGCWSIHMFFMRFAIDAVFLDAEWRVVKLVSNLRPWRCAMSLQASAVLELSAGSLKGMGLALGEVVSVRRSDQVESREEGSIAG